MSKKLVRSFLILFSGIGLVTALYFGSVFFQPLAFAALLAMLVAPLFSWLRRMNWPSWLSVSVSLLAIVLAFTGIFLLVGWQIGQLSSDWPEMKERVVQVTNRVQAVVENRYNISEEQWKGWLQQSGSSLAKQLMWQAGNLFGLLAQIILTLAYTALFLSMHKRFQVFFSRYMPWGKKRDAQQVMREISQVSQNYLGGRLLVIGILAGVYMLGFWIAGIKYPFLLGLITALLSIVPYLGNVLGGGIAMLLSLVSGGGTSSIFIILGVMTAGQLLENYFLVPKVVGEEVDLNPFAAIVCVVGFGLVWGVSGAIIAIPLTGIIHVLARHIDALEPIQLLLGNSAPTEEAAPSSE